MDLGEGIPMRRCRRAVLAAVAVIGLAGCAAKQPPGHAGSYPRTAVDVPDRFIVVASSGPVERPAGEGCRNPIVDPRNGSRLTLIRSADGRGDYEAQPLRYGLGKRELLRVDCESGRVVGIVKR